MLKIPTLFSYSSTCLNQNRFGILQKASYRFLGRYIFTTMKIYWDKSRNGDPFVRHEIEYNRSKIKINPVRNIIVESYRENLVLHALIWEFLTGSTVERRNFDSLMIHASLVYVQKSTVKT